MSHIKRTVSFETSAGNEASSMIDSVTHAINQVSYEHHEIHAGSSFTVDLSTDLGNGAAMNLQITTPDTTKWAHLVYSVYTEAELS